MQVLLVHIRVKEDMIEAFCEATIENARASRLEPGVARFDVLEERDDPTRFTLVEAYRTPEDPARHKETAHYKRWCAAVEPMMAEQRRRAWCDDAFPDGRFL